MKILDAMPQRYPTNVTLELTLRCNLHCKMCMFRHSDSEDKRLLENELTAEQWADMAQQICDAGALNLLITGGEPLIRKDFSEIYRAFYKLGFIITLYTNAIPVTEEIMETFRECPPHRIGITLYGSTNETYEKLCGCADGFDRAMAGIEALSELPSLLEFRTTVVQDNFDEIDCLSHLIKEKFNSMVTHSFTVFQSVRGGSMPVAQCRLTPEQNIDLTVKRTADAVRDKIPADMLNKIELRLVEKELCCTSENKKYTLLGCNGGMDSCTLTWDGKLLGCQMLGCFQTDALKLGFAKAWDEWPYTVRLPEVNEECRACKHIDDCTVCPAVRMAECGDLRSKPEYICSLTKGLAMKKGENLL